MACNSPKSTILIDSITIGKRFRRDLGDISILAKSIQEVGLLQPLVVTEDYELIAGQRRLEACRSLSWTNVPVHFVNIKQILKGEFHENAVRKDFTYSEMVAIKREIEPAVKEESKARMLKGHPCADSSQGSSNGKTRDKVADYIDISHDTLSKAEKIVKAAEENPEKFGDLLAQIDSKKISVDYAYDTLKRSQDHASPRSLPEGQYDIIYADPAWEYDFDANRGSASAHYPTMTTEEICKLKIPAAEEGSMLFLWATSPKIPDALRVMESWGFEYKTMAIWKKDKIGTGYYLREMHEHLLFGKKGKHMPVPETQNRYPSVFDAPRTKEHSEKPEIVYEMIEHMYPSRKYLELFARKNRNGWVSWGNEL